MSYYLDTLYSKGSLNRSSYNLRQDYMGADQKIRRDKFYDDVRYQALRNKYGRVQSQKQYKDPIVSSLKRDQLTMSKHNPSLNKSIMSTEMSSKKYLPQSTSFIEQRLSPHLSQSSILYPYTYTEYSLMKSKIEQKKIAQEKWLQSQIQRIRTENLLYESKYSTKTKQSQTSPLRIQQKLKNKQILNQLKQSKFQKHLFINEKFDIREQITPKFSQNVNNKVIIKRDINQILKESLKRNDSNTFLYNDLKQSNSDYEQEYPCHNQKQQKRLDINQLCDQRVQKMNQERTKKPTQTLIKNQEQINLSQKKDTHPYKRQERKQKQKSKTYSKLIVFNSMQNLQQQKSSSQKSQTLLENQHQLQFLQSRSQDMDFYRRGTYHYPIFSPLKNHKHLPLNLDEHVSYNSDIKKGAKHYRALEEKKQNEYKGHQNPRTIIVDELEKKKILSKSIDHHTFAERKIFYQHRRNQENIMLDRQPMRNPQVQLTKSHVYQLNHSSEAVANGLRVDLEILKQQLDDKNKKVVDLQIELLQLKSSILLKTFEKKTNQISTETQLPQDDKISQPLIFQDDSSQTVTPLKNLDFSHQNVSLKIIPSRNLKNKESELQKQRSLRKKLQQKLKIQEEAMTNFLQDIEIYQKKNKQLENKIKTLQSQKNITDNN